MKEKKRGGHQAAATKPATRKGRSRGGAPSTKEHATAKQEKKRRARTDSREAGGKKNAKHSAKAQVTRGRKQENARNNGGADKEKKNTRNGAAKQSRQPKRPGKKVRRTTTRPGGRPARPGQEEQAHAHTRGTQAWRPPTRKGRCRRPHETAPVHRPSPLSNDVRSGKPDASVTGSTHANHCSARSPRPTPEGPARDNPVVGPRAGTTRREPSDPASAGASGRHKEPGSRPAFACPAQPPSKAGGASPRGGERHHGDRKADRSPESDRTERGASHHAGPRGTPERHAAGHSQGTRTGAKQRRPPAVTNPESAHNTQRTTAHEQVPGNSQPKHHKPQPGVAGRSQNRSPNTHPKRTPQPEVAGRSGNPSPNTHTHTAHPCQEWLGASGARTRAHTQPNTPARSGGAQPKPKPKHTHPHRAPEPGVARCERSAHTSTHTAQHPSQEWRGAAKTRAQTHTPTPRIPARSGRV